MAREGTVVSRCFSVAVPCCVVTLPLLLTLFSSQCTFSPTPTSCDSLVNSTDTNLIVVNGFVFGWPQHHATSSQFVICRHGIPHDITSFYPDLPFYPFQPSSPLILLAYVISVGFDTPFGSITSSFLFSYSRIISRRQLLLLLLKAGTNLINPSPDLSTLPIKTLPHGVKIAHLNVRDLLSKNKKDDLTCLLNVHLYDVMVVSESWLYPDVEDSEVRIPGYQLLRKDRAFSNFSERGGGICVYVREDWQVIEFPCFQTKHPIESIKLTIKKKFVKPFTIIALYRPRKLPVGEYREIEKLVVSHSEPDTYIIGDLNLDFSRPITPECRKFRSMLFQHGFIQLVSDPTHHYVSNGVHKSSVIDLIITNSKSFQNVSGVMSCSLSPDHDLVYVVRQHVNNKKGPAKSISYRP